MADESTPDPATPDPATPDPATLRLDPVTLRGLAHPLRVRILGVLREHGPANATTLSHMLGQSTGATSYHLRQLASYGFIVEDTEPAKPAKPAKSAKSAKGGRERWWKAAHRGTFLDEQVARHSPEVTEAYTRAIAAQYHERIDRWLNEALSMPPEWIPAATLSDWRFRLTPEEAKQLHDAIFELVERFRRDEPGADVPGAEVVVFQAQILPFTGSRQ
ncbi:MAG TPA: winged helix-turn-helix domain-containing protein [Candidatus Limnocylindrales bacterium]|nr:winged helix-turn-helix domain-containing protein [Candidatus Limnocylindrales bacterium]